MREGFEIVLRRVLHVHGEGGEGGLVRRAGVVIAKCRPVLTHVLRSVVLALRELVSHC